MLEKKNILIVEDDHDLLWLLKKILSMNGFNILQAVTAEEADQVFTQNLKILDAIILDLSLPDEHGKTVCKKILDRLPEIPVIITTGYEESTQQAELENMGVSAYLIKPFDIMKLVKIVSDLTRPA
ncbi:MAG: response regulator [Calditrichia bacterium]